MKMGKQIAGRAQREPDVVMLMKYFNIRRKEKEKNLLAFCTKHEKEIIDLTEAD